MGDDIRAQALNWGEPGWRRFETAPQGLDNYLRFLYFLIYLFIFCRGSILAKLVRFSKQMANAILMLVRYVKDATGTEPSQEEIANALKSYFILNELGNQIKFQRKQPPAARQPLKESRTAPFWRLNMKDGPARNSLVRVGLFYKDIQDAIKAAQNFVKSSSGDEPSEEDIALGLQCDFILSEIKNQINWQRNSLKRNKKTNPR